MTVVQMLEYKILLAFEIDKLVAHDSHEALLFQMQIGPSNMAGLIRGCFLCDLMIEIEWMGCGNLCCTAHCGLTGESVKFNGTPYKGCQARWPPEEDWEKL